MGKDNMPPDYVIRISLVRDEASLAELRPPVWRRFKASSALNLEILHDKILAPVMGWEVSKVRALGISSGCEHCLTSRAAPHRQRNYHTYYFRKANSTAKMIFLQEDTQAADLVHTRHFGGGPEGDFAKPEDETIGGLLKEAGDKCVYNYDLGDNFYHCLELEKIVPSEESDGKVELMDGEMRCPDEDGDGSSAYQKGVLDLLAKSKAKPSDATLARKLAQACFARRNALNVRGSFRPQEFDPDERRAALAKALGSRNSTRNTTKVFSTGGFQYALMGQQHVVHKKQDDRFDHMGGFVDMHETVNVKPDSIGSTLCYQCGSPNALKSCARCRAAFYCSRECQVAAWSSGLPQPHKRRCKKEKAAVEKYEKEAASGKPDPNRFDVPGEWLLTKKYDPDKLRFKVGDRVECLIGEQKWGTGRIVKLRYREPEWPSSKPSAPYQVKLDRETANREGVPPQYALIYSDWDDDLKIRRLP